MTHHTRDALSFVESGLGLRVTLVKDGDTSARRIRGSGENTGWLKLACIAGAHPNFMKVASILEAARNEPRVRPKLVLRRLAVASEVVRNAQA